MPQKILLVEDDELISDMYKIKFEAAGYAVSVCPDGTKALDTAKTFQPDIILLDVVMPKISGYEVLQQLKTNPATKAIKTYILSNLVQSGEIDQGFDAGADGYLVKSDLTPGQLVNCVRKALAGETIGINQDQAAPAKPAKTRSKLPKAVPEPASGQKRILIIEDEDDLIDMYKVRLEQAGYQVDAAKNGAWGMKMAKSQTYDLILLDMVMPAMNGHDAIKGIKAGGASRRAPIIVLSNSAQDRDIKSALECGAANYLLKASITPAKVVAEVKKALAK